MSQAKVRMSQETQRRLKEFRRMWFSTAMTHPSKRVLECDYCSKPSVWVDLEDLTTEKLNLLILSHSSCDDHVSDLTTPVRIQL